MNGLLVPKARKSAAELGRVISVRAVTDGVLIRFFNNKYLQREWDVSCQGAYLVRETHSLIHPMPGTVLGTENTATSPARVEWTQPSGGHKQTNLTDSSYSCGKRYRKKDQNVPLRGSYGIEQARYILGLVTKNQGIRRN